MKVRSQSQAVIEYLGKRPVTSNMVGNVTGVVPSFEQIQRNFYDKMIRAVNDVLGPYDLLHDARKAFQSLKSIVVLTGTLECSAAAILAYAATGYSPDTAMTFIAGSSLSVLGAITDPFKTSQTWEDYRRNAKKTGQKNAESMLDASNGEITKLNQKIVEGIAPYRRFCQAERDRNQRLRTESEEILADGHSLRRRIEKKR